jgi:hypothetical protein
VEWVRWLLNLALLPLIGWIYRTSSRQDRIEDGLNTLKDDMHDVKSAIGKIRDHITGVKLHGE